MVVTVITPEIQSRIGIDGDDAKVLEQKGYDARYISENPNAKVDLTDNPVIGELPNFNNQQVANWIEAARILYNSALGPRPQERRKTGQIRGDQAQQKFYEEDDFGGDLTMPPNLSDLELAEWAKELMGAYNYRPEEWIDYLSNVDNMDSRQQLAFYELLSGYDRLPNFTWEGTGRFLKYTFTSPSTYVGLGTFGIGLAARQAFKEGGKAGFKAYIKSRIGTASALAIEGGAYTGFDDLMRQTAEINTRISNPEIGEKLGLKTEIDKGQLATATATGAVVAPVLGEALPLAGKGVVKGVQAGKELISDLTDPNVIRSGLGPTGGKTPPGRPPGLDSPQKLGALRRNLTKLATEGEDARFWYEQSGKAILDMVGGDVNEADKIAQAIAITSSGSTPVGSNFDFAMQAYAQWKAGNKIFTGKFPTDQSRRLELAFSEDGWSGRKTNTFYNNLMRQIDPSREQGATVDIHMMRAFGFTNKDGTPYSGTPTDAQYTFVENETKRIADQLGWEPQQAQAAIWVANKARNAGKSVDDMKFDYSDAAEKNLGQISWESIPGREGRHLGEIFNAPYNQQAEYHVAVSKAFLDDDGNDLVAKRLGLPSPGDFEAPGHFEGKVSPGTQTKVIAPRQYKGAKFGEIEASSEDLISAYAAVRGILMKQDGVGWHRPFYKTTRKNSNGIEVGIGRPFSEAETKQLADLVAQYAGHGEFSPIAFGEGVRFVNFDYVGLDNLEFQGILEKALKDMQFEGTTEYLAKRFHAYTGYAGNDWKVNKNGEGYMGGRWSGRPDLQRRVQDIIKEVGPRVDAVDEDFSARYGWTRNQELNQKYRGRPDGVGDPPPMVE